MDTKCVKQSEERQTEEEGKRENNPSPCLREQERETLKRDKKKQLINEYREKERRRREMFESENLAVPSHERTYLAEDGSQVQRTY